MTEDNIIYECKCENRLFFLRKDGEVECANCKCTFSDIKVIFEDGWKIKDNYE